MFKELAQFGQILNHARQLSGKVGDVQRQLADRQISGESEDGRVTVVLTGQGQMVRCEISQELLNLGAKTELERQIVEATNAAQQRVRETALAAIGDAAGGLDLSSLADVLPRFGAG